MRLRVPAVLLTAFVLMTAGAWGQQPEKKLSCEERGNRGEQFRACEMREFNVGSLAALSVDAAPNGGISVHGADRRDILVRARVEAWSKSAGEAETRVKEVRVSTDGGKVKSDGPKFGQETRYSVSYEVFVPARIDLALNSVNGGVTVSGVTGSLTAETVNGGLNLSNLNGKVKARTTNGGVNVKLAGAAWQGEGVDVQTTNGGVKIAVPENYSARLEAKTTNGGLRSDLPLRVQGELSKRIEGTLGNGGALIKITTSNGGIQVNKVQPGA